jgi:hypothetical protein
MMIDYDKLGIALNEAHILSELVSLPSIGFRMPPIVQLTLL